MRTYVRVLLFYALLASLLLTPGAPAWAAPQLPSSFYGTVIVDGAPVPNGTVVTAWIKGVQYAQATTSTNQGASVYTLDVRGDDPETPGVIEGGVAGDTIVFKVGGQVVSQTATWQTGSNVALNLSYTTPTAVSVALPVDKVLPLNSEGTVPISLPNTVPGSSIYAYTFALTFDPGVIEFAGVDKSATLSGDWTISHNATGGQLQVAAYGTSPLSGSGPLLNLRFKTSNNGGARSDLIFTSFKFNEGMPAAQPANGSIIVGSLNISGQVQYIPTGHSVSGTILSATGASVEKTTSGSNGFYTLPIHVVGEHVVTPSKSGDLRDALSGLDASYILQYVVGSRSFNEYQTRVADVSQFDGITAYDAALVALHLVGIQDPPSHVGKWFFKPDNRAYTPLNGDAVDQNYTVGLFGDVTENWGPVAAQLRAAGANAPLIALPEIAGTPGQTVRIAVQLNGIGAADVYAIELVLTFDEAVVALQKTSLAAQVDSNWQLVTNNSPNQVSLVAFGASPVQTAGDMLYLDFQVIGQEGHETALTPVRLRINEEEPTMPVEAAGKIIVRSGEQNNHALFLPLIGGTDSARQGADKPLDLQAP